LLQKYLRTVYRYSISISGKAKSEPLFDTRCSGTCM